MGVTKLGRMMGTDPNSALSVLDGLGRWEAGRSAGGMDLQRKGWVRVQDRAGETGSSSSSSSSSSISSGGRTPPPREKTRATSRVARKTPPPRSPAEQAQRQT